MMGTEIEGEVYDRINDREVYKPHWWIKVIEQNECWSSQWMIVVLEHEQDNT